MPSPTPTAIDADPPTRVGRHLVLWRLLLAAIVSLLVVGATPNAVAADDDDDDDDCWYSCSSDDDDDDDGRTSWSRWRRWWLDDQRDDSSTSSPAEPTTDAAADPSASDEPADPAPEPTPSTPPPAPTTDEVFFQSSTADAASRPGSMYSIVDQIGARELWAQGLTGAGVDVAVIDTGIAPVPALLGPDKVGAMVDLSFEAGIPEAVYLDTYGHGTHIAGIIAGSDPGGDPATAADRPAEFHGVAPGARIISLKVGDNTGAVDVSQVIAAIDWVVEHRNAGDLNIRVLNLSYGTDSEQSYLDSPLAHAVERAWAAGIVVVVAAGNDGWREPGLASPANDPYVISVGAAAPREGADSFTIPDWASGGELFTAADNTLGWAGYWSSGYTGRYPDLVAPGASVESLRVPGSRVANDAQAGMVNETILRGSGTSQAAAVVSGAAALLLQQRPDLTPDQVKALLTSSADRLDWVLTTLQGGGMLDVAAAAAAPTPDAVQTWPRSTGLGSLDAARGTIRVTLDGAPISGEITAFGDGWDAVVRLDLIGTSGAWTDGAFSGSSWTGSSWTGSSWTGSSWTGSSWTGSSWTGSSWTGSSWTGSSWTGSSWTGSSWTGSSWTGSSWTGSSWTGSSWTGSSWTGTDWTGYGWLGVSWN